jgi:hypothetical protein
VRASKIKVREHGSRVNDSGSVQISGLSTAGMFNPNLHLSQMPRDSFGRLSHFENSSVISSNLNQTIAPRESSNFYFEGQLLPIESEKRKLVQQTSRPPTLTALPRISESNGQLIYQEPNNSRHSVALRSDRRTYTTQVQSLYQSQPPSTFKASMQAINEIENQLFPREQMNIPVYSLKPELVEEFKE